MPLVLACVILPAPLEVCIIVLTLTDVVTMQREASKSHVAQREEVKWLFTSGEASPGKTSAQPLKVTSWSQHASLESHLAVAGSVIQDPWALGPNGPSLKVTWAFAVEVPLSPDCIMRHCDCQESQAGCQSPEQPTLMSRKHPVMLRACGPSFINCGFRSFAPILRHRWKPRVSWPLCPVSVSTLKLIRTKSILFTNGFFFSSHQ